MTDHLTENASSNNLKQHLKEETAPMSWADLAPFFARGQLIAVSSEMNLLDVAVAISEDRREDVERWLTSRDVMRVDDALAKQWNDEQPQLMTVVIAPWVLAQILTDSKH